MRRRRSSGRSSAPALGFRLFDGHTGALVATRRFEGGPYYDPAVAWDPVSRSVWLAVRPAPRRENVDRTMVEFGLDGRRTGRTFVLPPDDSMNLGGSPGRRVTFSPDGRYLATSVGSILDVRTGRLLRRPPSSPSFVRWYDDQHYVRIGAEGNAVVLRVVDVSGRTVRELHIPAEPEHIVTASIGPASAYPAGGGWRL